MINRIEYRKWDDGDIQNKKAAKIVFYRAVLIKPINCCMIK